MLRISSALRTKLATLTAAALAAGVSPFVAVGTAHAATFGPALNCPAETFPAAGAPRSAAANPYHVPFNADLGIAANNADGGLGGFITVDAPGSLAQLTLGPPDAASTTGTLFGNACGTFALPALTGSIPALPTAGQAGGVTAPGGNPNYNNNFILHGAPFGAGGIGNKITVGLAIAGLGLNITTLKGTGSADGTIVNALGSTPAANGGLTASFSTSAKATAVVDPSALASLLPLPANLPASLLGPLSQIAGVLGSGTGGECTLSIGDQRLTGYSPNLVGPYTKPVTLSTTDTADGGKALTGPIKNAQGAAASTGIPQPPIDANATPDPLAPGAGTTAPSALCNPTVAGALNMLLGLPYVVNGSPGGVDKFVAPITVQAYASQ